MTFFKHELSFKNKIFVHIYGIKILLLVIYNGKKPSIDYA